MEKKEYRIAALAETPRTPDELLSGSFNDEIKERMETVIRIEGPIRESLLYKRVLNSYSLYKNGSLLNTLLTTLSSSLPFPATVDIGSEKVFHTGEDEDYFRPTPLGETRYSYQISDREGANAILYILETGDRSSYTKSELYRLFMTEMGYQRSGDRIEELFQNALKDERIKRSGNGRIIK